MASIQQAKQFDDSPFHLFQVIVSFPYHLNTSEKAFFLALTFIWWAFKGVHLAACVCAEGLKFKQQQQQLNFNFMARFMDAVQLLFINKSPGNSWYSFDWPRKY